MTEAAEVDAGLRQSREQTVLAHLEAENRQDVAATLATFKPGAARTELPGRSPTVLTRSPPATVNSSPLFQTCTSTSMPAHCVTTVTA
jgi:hypothetical protein